MKSIADYIKKIEKHRSAHFRIRDGVGMFVVNGIEISVEEWNESNPMPIYIKRNDKKGDNPDRTREWMHL